LRPRGGRKDDDAEDDGHRHRQNQAQNQAGDNTGDHSDDAESGVAARLADEQRRQTAQHARDETRGRREREHVGVDADLLEPWEGKAGAQVGPREGCGERLKESNAAKRQTGARHTADEGQHHALEPAAVVNEALLRLFQSRYRLGLTNSIALLDWQSRAHILALASRQMRLVLNDYVTRRTRTRTRVSTHITIALKDPVFGDADGTHDFTFIDRLLKLLAETDANLSRILEMCCFGGMSDREIALVEHSSTSKAKKDRELAHNWLADAVLANSADIQRHITEKEVSK